jgi:hypothetical protein
MTTNDFLASELGSVEKTLSLELNSTMAIPLGSLE